ncbi:hypothetical protein B0H15DRAFT_871401 [Mycena belliarum]|uniref:Uncharacterized protein n=1 Tax=Mycena belliarum TaxID=1033014 RepID=A0AAD6XDU9_9AGAR|nr:hypothetical protein B0H15DRAFT_871401 [Mycena belliae]
MMRTSRCGGSLRPWLQNRIRRSRPSGSHKVAISSFAAALASLPAYALLSSVVSAKPHFRPRCTLAPRLLCASPAVPAARCLSASHTRRQARAPIPARSPQVGAPVPSHDGLPAPRESPLEAVRPCPSPPTTLRSNALQCAPSPSPSCPPRRARRIARESAARCASAAWTRP